jgi:hypothetical protein
LADALRALYEAAMSALKSWRDQLNRPVKVNLMLVMSGSDRDKRYCGACSSKARVSAPTTRRRCASIARRPACLPRWRKRRRHLNHCGKRSPALVWKSALGEYAVDDAAMHQWYRDRADAGAWPVSLDVSRVRTPSRR